MASVLIQCVCGIRYTLYHFKRERLTRRIRELRGSQQKEDFTKLLNEIIIERDLPEAVKNKLLRRAEILKQNPERRLKLDRMRYIDMHAGEDVFCDCGRILNLPDMLFNQLLLAVLVSSDESPYHHEMT
ncbi:hypothetical protein JW960_07415 [candidate division KSB1 bacterium]|nr:hypothetical protein [candidate division KSB1 bacterium]